MLHEAGGQQGPLVVLALSRARDKGQCRPGGLCGEELTRRDVQPLEGFLAAEMGEIGSECVSEGTLAEEGVGEGTSVGE